MEIRPSKSSAINITINDGDRSLDVDSESRCRKRCRTKSALDHRGADEILRNDKTIEDPVPSLFNLALLGQKSYPSSEPNHTRLSGGCFPEGKSTKNLRKKAPKSQGKNLGSLLNFLDTRQTQPLDMISESVSKPEKIGVEPPMTGAARIDDKPTKVLQLNTMTGTIYSSPAKKTITSDENKEGGEFIVPKQRKSKVIKISYNVAISPQLDQILNSNVSSNLTSKLNTPGSPECKILAPLKSGSALHPFFRIKSHRNPADTVAINKTQVVKTNEVSQEPTLGISNKRKSKPRDVESPSILFNAPLSHPPRHPTSYKTKRFAAAMEPAWPWKGMVHIRGLRKAELLLGQDLNVTLVPQSRRKKSKENAVNISKAENIFSLISNNIATRTVAQSTYKPDSDDIPRTPCCLRLPVKHYESGKGIQRWLRCQIRTPMPHLEMGSHYSSEGSIEGVGLRSDSPVHPALTKAYASVSTSLSAFDKGECESRAWTRKYSPNKAEEVLQIGHEALILKEWLSNLTVNSVDPGISRPGKSSITKSELASKRKRRSAKLDDFIILTDEEENIDLEEITDPNESSVGKSQYKSKRTLVRGGDGWMKFKDISKLQHTILISGPNGCGKSAAVYAAAKELDFEVFEINSSSKRSGKDIMEKIGDMTQNHHVQHIAETTSLDSIDEEKMKIDAALARDLETGRQGTMNSFLKSDLSRRELSLPSQYKKSPSSKTQGTISTGIEISRAKSASKPTKEQRQSLILIEEAEIVFREDSQFWPTIENIMAISRRPIIVTCNDESAVSIAHRSLYAILRFQPPPVDLAVDYMLSIAACEGHIIKREAVKALYEERRFDLRASLSDLNFWCQFAVGDINRGLSWYYSRQRRDRPIVEERGNITRILSDGTYEKGMGWISQDILESDLPHLEVEEELIHEISESWNLDISDWENSIRIDKWAGKIQSQIHTKKKHRAILNMFADFTESISDSDLISNVIFDSENQIALDPSIPRMCDKARDEYLLAYKVVEASPKVIYFNTGRSISLYLRSRARNHLQVTQHLKHNLEIQPELSSPSESQIIDLIRQKQTACPSHIYRVDFSRAFDAISFPNMKDCWTGGGFLEASQFDRTQRIISEDLAPYVRGIVAYDSRLQQERERRSNLLSEGGMAGKRRRTTRAAMSALEGGRRSETRRERYFGNALNSVYVRKTGLQSWIDAAVRLQMEREKLAIEELLDPIPTKAGITEDCRQVHEI